MRYRLAIFFLIILFTANIVNSEINIPDALTWINGNVNGNGPIDEVSFSVLALDNHNFPIPTLSEALIQRQDPNNCYPQGSCTTKDTALAALALNKLGRNTTGLIEWIQVNEQISDGNSKWLIQIKTSNTGPCKLTHNQIDTDITILENGLISPFNTNWLDIEDHLQVSIVNPEEEINVDCNGINDPGLIISLIKKNANAEFFIIQQIKKKSTTLSIKDSCYASSPSNFCDEDSTFYTSWALKKLGRNVNTISYLEDHLGSNLHRAILASITSYGQDLDELSNNQDASGSWDDNVFTTSIAIDALKSRSIYNKIVGNATEWINSKQITTGTNRGSIGDILDTSAAVYLVLANSPNNNNPTYCGDGITQKVNDDGQSEQCDFNDEDVCPGLCNLDTCLCAEESCTFDSECSTPDEFCSLGVCEQRERCSVSRECLAGFECLSNLCLPTDGPECGDGIKENTEECESKAHCEDNELCNSACNCISEDADEPICGNKIVESPEECETNTNCSGDDVCNSFTCQCESEEPAPDEEGFPIWILIVLIVVAIVILVGYLAYTKLSKKPEHPKDDFLGPSKPKEDVKPVFQKPKSNPHDEEIEKELDQSLKEAKDLLKKK